MAWTLKNGEKPCVPPNLSTEHTVRLIRILDTLEADTHGLVEVEEAVQMAAEFGVPRPYIEDLTMQFYDSRFEPKGLTVSRAHGHARTFAEAGITSRRIMKAYKEMWEESGQRWVGVPFVYGIAVSDLVVGICEYLGVSYVEKHGRGARVRSCCLALRIHFGIVGLV